MTWSFIGSLNQYSESQDFIWIKKSKSTQNNTERKYHHQCLFCTAGQSIYNLTSSYCPFSLWSRGLNSIFSMSLNGMCFSNVLPFMEGWNLVKLNIKDTSLKMNPPTGTVRSNIYFYPTNWNKFDTCEIYIKKISHTITLSYIVNTSRRVFN